MRSVFPPRPLLRDLVLTSVWMWVGIHVAVAIAGGGQGLRSPVVALALVPLVAVLVHLDRRSRGLDLLLANLGFSPRWLNALVLAVAGAVEAAFQLLLWAAA